MKFIEKKNTVCYKHALSVRMWRSWRSERFSRTANCNLR